MSRLSACRLGAAVASAGGSEALDQLCNFVGSFKPRSTGVLARLYSATLCVATQIQAIREFEAFFRLQATQLPPHNNMHSPHSGPAFPTRAHNTFPTEQIIMPAILAMNARPIELVVWGATGD